MVSVPEPTASSASVTLLLSTLLLYPDPGEYYSPYVPVTLTAQSDQGTIIAKSQAPQYSPSFQSQHLENKVPMP